MKINKLFLENFRCFRRLEAEFNPLTNIVVGDNGSGKTAVLDGIIYSLKEFLFRLMGSPPTLPVAAKDIRMNGQGGYEEMASASVVLDNGLVSGVRLSPDSRKDEEFADISRFPAYPVSRVDPVDWREIESLRREIIKNPSSSVVLPVFAYYRATRNLSFLRPVETQPGERIDRFDAIRSATDAFSDYQHVVHWFFQVYIDELIEKQESGNPTYVNHERRAATEAVVRMIPDAEGITFTQKAPRRLVLKWKSSGNGRLERRYVSQLSDGYRNMLALVMDFSRRLAQANPHLEAPLDVEALLLIDEIDLHLHPKWQQAILGDLRRVFPNTQIICTTHSPQVLSTAKPEEILVLDGDCLEPAAGKHSYGVQSNRVLNEIMGVAARPAIPEMEEKKRELMDAIKTNPERAKQLLAGLADTLGSDDPFIVNAKVEMIRTTSGKS